MGKWIKKCKITYLQSVFIYVFKSTTNHAHAFCIKLQCAGEEMPRVMLAYLTHLFKIYFPHLICFKGFFVQVI